MSRASQQIRKFAKGLILCETNGNGSKTSAAEAFGVFEKLRPQLAALMGDGGFQALLSRALALAGAEIAWLRAVQVKSDGTFGGLDKLPEHLDLDNFFEGRVVLLAHLLALLVEFIGENLTLRLMGELWPKARLKDLHLSNGVKHENKK